MSERYLDMSLCISGLLIAQATVVACMPLLTCNEVLLQCLHLQ